uniref:Uncharacterized protein n=1 Tax=Anguilla anguilla TaxID=7936 RepID=A0A0E9PG07_ANGAN
MYAILNLNLHGKLNLTLS